MENTLMSFWQMVWEQEVHLITTLSSIDAQECLPFWPSATDGSQTAVLELSAPGRKRVIRVTLLEEIDAPARRAIRVSLEARTTFLSHWNVFPVSFSLWKF